ncbi:hypothetical protein TWF696_005318 [Orbilia brochopaga]|uniref:Uncharacterized protein n=1 Tax=Orbilia brochopaga TaxID=3140254 RepID=A0AAV9V2S6_9PEZI
MSFLALLATAMGAAAGTLILYRKSLLRGHQPLYDELDDAPPRGILVNGNPSGKIKSVHWGKQTTIKDKVTPRRETAVEGAGGGINMTREQYKRRRGFLSG